MRAYLGLGGNVGDTRNYFNEAIEKLESIGTVEAVSSLYKTEPVGFAGQAWFLNCALILETNMPPEELLRAVKRIEKELDRTPTIQNGPREIDIDILLYGGLVLTTDSLTIPHVHLHERAFALLSLAEIASDALHPLLKKSVKEILSTLKDTHQCEKLPREDGFPTYPR